MIQRLTGIFDSSEVLAGVPQDTYAVDVTVEHTFQIVRDTGVFKAYVDGTEALTLGVAEGIGLDGNPGGWFFGACSSASSSVSYWKLWQLEDGVNIIPEPATLAVLAIGGVLALLRRRR